MEISRRNFLKKSAIVSAGAGLLSHQLFSSCSSYHQLGEIGLITGNTLRDAMKEDYVATLRRVAEIGYNFIEMGNYPGETLEGFKTLLNELKLYVLAGGSSLHGLEERTDEFIKTSHELEKKYLVCYWPWYDGADNITRDACMQSAEAMNKLGERCLREGIQFAWHNHDKEFRTTFDELPFDVLMKNTDPSLVKVQLDVYWISKGGQDPVEYIKKYPGRIDMLHLKDMAPGEEQDFECVGGGIIDFPGILSAAREEGIQHYIVEHDKPSNPMQCIEDSYAYLKSIKF